MPFDSTTSKDLTTVQAYVCSDAGAAVARAVFERYGGTASALHGGGLSGATRLSTGARLADIVLAEIGSIPVEMACECVAEISASGAHVIVLGDQADIATYRAMLKAGATDYFSFPVTPEDILAVRPKALVAAPVKLLSLAVMGSNGGVGASLLAQNLAFHAAAAKGAGLRTALIDADLQFGSQAIDMDRDETAGLFDALMAPERIDETFIGATMDPLADRLLMYSQQVRMGQDALPYEGGLSGILPPLPTAFEAVITDLPRETLMRREDLAGHFDALLLVMPAGFSGVSAATRLMERLSARNPDLAIQPVLSELHADAGLSRKDIERTLGHALAGTLPRCDAPIVRAQRAAKPLVAVQPRGGYAKAVKALWSAAQVARPATPNAAKPPVKRRFFG
ncbi:AAA family ATPase [Thalassorhabdomicrobium marinisediminis]|uniref:Response regulatory domain-containing protein n=1 Tax=Thalassorhabdomicrobium marinisediminis TaxID=2170577 RepID=A0A2T7FX68_9RHOB|nr:hypothetical protein [Thalassorhabdomicrobium marinisediminis]PVA06760.1 hypothetical protein DC363_09555 [Thalassorhabdomicrobium marinisediminis]